MKRSEMLAIIYDAFFDCLDIPNKSFVSNKKFDDYILNKIEEAGMLPPEAADFNIGNNWEPEEDIKTPYGKSVVGQVNADIVNIELVDNLVEKCYDILIEYEEPNDNNRYSKDLIDN